jgi:hypothetical protein
MQLLHADFVLESQNELVSFLLSAWRRTDPHDPLLLIYGADGAEPLVGLGQKGKIDMLLAVNLEKACVHTVEKFLPVRWCALGW